ncbi:unnamed protein product [Thelazia callipaeda]|uniref:6-pyruvoyl tetrahydrobiopterin synthase n=1 Tax=Thelazia callipaeda TaxID=103827 RepID=A0A0N5D9I0_THECL|nr:unnamed protein product [Thelazia callipaeda]
MGTVELTRQESFSASHRLHNQGLSDVANREYYGKCNNFNGHGHNYVWEVTVRGPVNKDSGLVYNLANLKNEMRKVLDEVDHKNLDKDIQFFAYKITSAENLVIYLWDKLKSEMSNPGLLYKMVLHETSKNSVTYYG